MRAAEAEVDVDTHDVRHFVSKQTRNEYNT